VERRGLLPDAERLERIGAVDVVIGVPGCTDGAAVAAARDTWQQALQSFRPFPRAVLVHADPGTQGAPDDVPDPGEGRVALLYAPMADAAQVELLGTAYSDTVRGVVQISQQLQARATGVLGTLSTDVSADEAVLLLTPVLEQGVDLMVPRHETRATEGLITRGIFGPLTRAIFGIRLHDPMVVNFVASAAVAARVAAWPAHGARAQAVWLANEAACSGMGIGEAFVRRPDPSGGQADLATVFATLLGSLFADIERHAACWQKIHASRPVLLGGGPRPVAEAAPAVDTARMVEAFRSAFSNLADVWSMLLPPATLLELKKLSRLPAEQFHMPDDLWARIVFDVTLGHRLRVISRDHLLRSFVQLYLAWVASWVMQAGDETAAGQQERLCVAFERQKPYLLSRWRWPDRFSP
jgi:glucosylglycerate synthase